MITGNKGDWSEIYALFKLLSDKILVPGDDEIQRIPDIFYPIIRILRSETSGDFEYSIEDDIVLISGNEEEIRMPIEIFKEKALYLLNYIKSIKSKSDGSFSVPVIEDFMRSINCISLKANSSVKTDITIVIHDQRTNQQPTLGFSVKSQLGSASTLFNAVLSSNFIYEVSETVLSDDEMNEVNSLFIKRGKKLLRDVKGRTKLILQKGANLSFIKVEKPVFSNNLMLIDSLLPEILSEIVVSYYSGKSSLLSELVNNIERINPLRFDITNNHEFYRYKIKRFLTDTALGMLPSKVWNGKYDATGGYLVVKEDGNILCYHLYNRNEFENYLINNTKLETPSSSRHGFGELHKENNKMVFKLNLQIRFIK